MEENGNNTYLIDRSVSIMLYIDILQHQFYTFSKNNSTLIVKGAISSLTISGNNNKIIFKREILNLIINGSNNKIEVGPNSQNVCNIQNGANNIIYMNNNNGNVRINNQRGNNNNNLFNFGGSNISINFNGGNPNGQISKLLYITLYIQILNKL